MSEVLRDLVVSLSLDGDNFSRNLTSINKQIQEAESEFKRAASGVDNFEKSVKGTQAQLSSLQQKLSLQQKAVTQYQRALEAANKKLETHIPGRANSRTHWIRPNRRTLPSNLRSPPPPGNMSSTPARWANRIPRPSLPRPIWTRCRRNTRSPPPRSKNWKASSPPTPRRCKTTRTP